MSRFTIETSGPLVTLSFDDGGMNLLSSAALAELHAVIDSLAGRRGLLIFRSGSPRLFAAGADMQEMAGFGPLEAENFSRAGQELFAMIERLELATAAFIDGHCFGGALDLALSFDLVVATPQSRFSHPGARLGIVTGFGGTTRWRQRMAGATGRKLFLGSGAMTSQEALRAGIVDLVVEGPAAPALLASMAERASALPEFLSALRRVSSGPADLLLLARRSSDLYSRLHETAGV